MLALLLAVGLPGAAQPCLLAAPGRAPTLEGLRVVAKRQVYRVEGREVPGWDAQLVLAYDVIPEGQSIGIVFPVDAGVGIEMDLQDGADIVSALVFIDEVTEPVIHETRNTSCQGCDALDPILVPPPVAEGLTWQTDWDSSGYQITTASTVAELDGWLQQRSFVLSSETREALLLALLNGQKIVLGTATPGPGFTALYPIRIQSPGPLNLPLSLVSECGDRNMEITVFAVADQPSTLEGWDVVYLDEIDRDLFRDLPGLSGVYERLTFDHRGELFVIEAVMDLEGDGLFEFSFDTTVNRLLGEQGLLTRFRALVDASDLENDARLVLDPDGHEVSNQLDLRPDPEAHGASLAASWLWLSLALLYWLTHRPRP